MTNSVTEWKTPSSSRLTDPATTFPLLNLQPPPCGDRNSVSREHLPEDGQKGRPGLAIALNHAQLGERVNESMLQYGCLRIILFTLPQPVKTLFSFTTCALRERRRGGEVPRERDCPRLGVAGQDCIPPPGPTAVRVETAETIGIAPAFARYRMDA
jgi:hypothetical protein